MAQTHRTAGAAKSMGERVGRDYLCRCPEQLLRLATLPTPKFGVCLIDSLSPSSPDF